MKSKQIIHRLQNMMPETPCGTCDPHQRVDYKPNIESLPVGSCAKTPSSCHAFMKLRNVALYLGIN